VNNLSDIYSSMPKGNFDYQNGFLLSYCTDLMEEIQKANQKGRKTTLYIYSKSNCIRMAARLIQHATI